MRPLQEKLASEFATIAIDWPGFGDQPRSSRTFRRLKAFAKSLREKGEKFDLRSCNQATSAAAPQSMKIPLPASPHEESIYGKKDQWRSEALTLLT